MHDNPEQHSAELAHVPPIDLHDDAKHDGNSPPPQRPEQHSPLLPHKSPLALHIGIPLSGTPPSGGGGGLTGTTPQVVSMEVTTTVKAAPAELKPYNQGQGHHVPSKRAFEGAPNYDAKKALAIPNAELARLNVNHGDITNAQRPKYIEFAKSGKQLSWDAVAKIETEALVAANMSPGQAQATVAKAIQALKDSGVPGPMRIPWGPK